MSSDHKYSLSHCWPRVVEGSSMLQNSDILLFTTEAPAPPLLETAFGQTNGVKIHLYENPGNQSSTKAAARDRKQSGAKLAMKEAIRNQKEWFGEYDWIIRVNPDVLITHDPAFYTFMKDPDVDAILVNCRARKKRTLLHTDFFAIRPKVLPVTEINPERDGQAEHHLTWQLRDTLKSGRYVWMPNVTQLGNYCRVRGKDSPVLHLHDADTANSRQRRFCDGGNAGLGNSA